MKEKNVWWNFTIEFIFVTYDPKFSKNEELGSGVISAVCVRFWNGFLLNTPALISLILFRISLCCCTYFTFSSALSSKWHPEKRRRLSWVHLILERILCKHSRFTPTNFFSVSNLPPHPLLSLSIFSYHFSKQRPRENYGTWAVWVRYFFLLISALTFIALLNSFSPHLILLLYFFFIEDFPPIFLHLFPILTIVTP